MVRTMSKTIYVLQMIECINGDFEHIILNAYENYEDAVKSIEYELEFQQNEALLCEDGYLYGSDIKRIDDGQIRAELDEFNYFDLIVEPVTLN